MKKYGLELETWMWGLAMLRFGFWYLEIFKNIYIIVLFIYFWLRLLLCGLSPSGGEQGPLSSCGARASHCGVFSCWAGAEHAGFSGCGVRAQSLRFPGSRAQAYSCGAWTWLLCCMWNLPGPGIEPMLPALAGGFFTTEPPGKPWRWVLNDETGMISGTILLLTSGDGARQTEKVLRYTNCHLNTIPTQSLPLLASPHSLGLEILFIYSFGCARSSLQHAGSFSCGTWDLFPDEGWNPGPLHWECGVCHWTTKEVPL